jgi:two-component system nitrogen regulation response regulator NtrX
MRRLRDLVEKAGPTDGRVLVTGENGTGKELVARTIHNFSQRAAQPLITVGCAAIPEELIDSELFGHEKGAIPGATSKKRGKFELANNGSIFLDEIGDMSLKTQSKLLRVLQDQNFNRVGGTRTITVDVRVIAATNKDLESAIEAGTFREDLYYRLNVIPIEVPALRDRIEDLPQLVNTFLDEFARQNRGQRKRLSESALELLCRYSWPGNVRELRNLIERLVIMVDKETIDLTDLPEPYNPACRSANSEMELKLSGIDSLKQARKVFENEFIRKKLEENDLNVSKTAESIGVGRTYLHKKLKEIK